MYANYTNEELRRVLNTNPKDAEALVEAADRFCKSTGEEDEILKCSDCGSYDVRPV